MKHADFLRYLNGTIATTLQDEIAYITISVLSRPKKELKSPEKLNKEVFRYLNQRWAEALKRDMVKLVAALDTAATTNDLTSLMAQAVTNL